MFGGWWRIQWWKTPKRKRKGRPRDDEPTFQRRKVIGRIGDIDSLEFATFPLDGSLFLPSPYLDDLSCYNCHCIANLPVEVTTYHYHLCMECMKGGLMACHCNDNTFLAEHINSPSPHTVKKKKRAMHTKYGVLRLSHLEPYMA